MDPGPAKADDVLCLSPPSAQDHAQPRERLVYEMRLGPLLLGRAELRAWEEDTATGQRLRLRLDARRAGLGQLAGDWTLLAESLLAPDLSVYHSFHRRVERGDAVREWLLVPGNGTAQRRELKPRFRIRAPFRVPPGSLDPLGAFWALLRTAPLENAPIVRATDGRHNQPLSVKVLGRERVHVPAGEFEALKLQLILPLIEGVARLDRNEALLLWVGADRRQLPLRLQCRDLFTGGESDWRAELLSAEELQDRPRRPEGFVDETWPDEAPRRLKAEVDDDAL